MVRLKGPNLKTANFKIFSQFFQRPIDKGITFLNTAFVKVAINENAETTFVSSDNEGITGPAEEMLILPAPFVHSEFTTGAASKCKKPRFTRADKVFRDAGHAR